MEIQFRRGKYIRQKRTWLVSLALILAFSALLWRLYGVQMGSSVSFSREETDLIARAEEQQSRVVVVDSGRGSILDRHGESLTGTRDWRLFASPFSQAQVEAHHGKLGRLASLLGWTEGQLVHQLKSLTMPAALSQPDGRELVLKEKQAQMVRELEISGIDALESDDRWRNRGARQVIGRVERNPFLIQQRFPEEWEHGLYNSHSRIGVTGLESSFEPFLRADGSTLLSYTTDGRGRPLNGLSMKVEGTSEGASYRLLTTLDRRIQAVAERALDDAAVGEGAVLVQEIASGDLLAVASRPSEYNQEKEWNPWDNRALMETTPGSIFKTVVAVAALDTGKVKPTDKFHCNGHLGRYGLRDSNPDGHGTQTLEQAYANSCNVVFAQVAENLGGKTLEKYAHRLGLGSRVLWSGTVFKEKGFRQLPQEHQGVIFSDEATRGDAGAVAQTGIGQRDVRVTPLQAVNMVTTLFHDGQTLNPRVVKEIQRDDNETFFAFEPHTLAVDQSIKPETLRQLRKMMRTAVTDGTAQSLKPSDVKMAAKTGTAQLGPDYDHFNKWMIGFGPTDEPRYAISVVIRSVEDSKDDRAHRVFRQVMEQTVKGEKPS
ncbi:peptidoglycan D,D-transpeptidase FtsI family protein [Desmospora profundinema]|uniref:Cell division protein FtsI/penicillin-binding protein 2 n=1 Tax=Desmospora profundinema TaxID=1571184 RepID=A0ABU1IK76_9BACL|nr:penicillin-binding protein 2 [Desmospora profundinema]MDR6225184.1 cell division protein FtsI/penicillin-binding protein 2 [Desmospora profundinema]